ncbi:hypothetical protein F5050DRAFT_1810982 [Lentinula boryana]|uniref:DUF6534 domain-containing protein n=1 Tax=Lentinula boryana TaxID=40481 RepID=A0ABQ8Q3D1_9AGAR|nr:hypothetical protein F5050DRAFT_1810982 [Lentinula boryana]
MTPLELHQAVFLLGPWLIGAFLDVLLQGILFGQFIHYAQWYRDDKTGLKLAVVGLAIITTLKSIQAFALVWILFIRNFLDLPGAILLNYTTWWQSGNPLMVAAIGLYVQAYFCYRLYMIAKSPLPVIPLALLFLFAFAALSIGTYYITISDTLGIGRWFAAHLASVFAGDLMLSLVTAYFLIRSKKNVLPQTVGLITALIRLTFQTAAPAAICALLNLIFSQIYNGNENITSTAFNMMLPKLYAVSMMWTLNARRSIGAAYGTSRAYTNPSSVDRTTRRVRTGAGRHDPDVELGDFGGIQIHTQLDRHVDVWNSEDDVKQDGLKIGETSETSVTVPVSTQYTKG